MTEKLPTFRDEVRELLRGLASIGPAVNRFTQMLMLLPERAVVLLKIYPEYFEREDEIRELFGLTYSSDGSLTTSYLSSHLKDAFSRIFLLLRDKDKRKKLLDLIGVTEEEFKEFDPLRMWMDVGMDYLHKAFPESLKLLNTIVAKLMGRRPDDYLHLRELEEVKDYERSLRLLR